MSTILRIGTTIVIFALAAYSVAIVTEQRKKIINKTVLVFITLGVILDITATTFMVIGSSKGAFTLHGFIGYSSLLAMTTDAILIWKQKSKNGINSSVPKGLHLYSRYAYIWWVLAFITGGLLVAIR
ncbi:MAG: hypothetical protein JXR61_04215 [Prolixibacteraceae bacterium]|nr:hypothetical protein [Prolixibacteraceae bacterium]